MDARTLKALTAMFCAAMAVFVRNAHAAPARACTITGTPGVDGGPCLDQAHIDRTIDKIVRVERVD